MWLDGFGGSGYKNGWDNGTICNGIWASSFMMCVWFFTGHIFLLLLDWPDRASEEDVSCIDR